MGALIYLRGLKDLEDSEEDDDDPDKEKDLDDDDDEVCQNIFKFLLLFLLDVSDLKVYPDVLTFFFATS